MAAEKRYLARIYRAKHQQQKTRFQGVLIGCTDTSYAVLADASTMGAVRLTEKIVRALSDEANPDPRSPGLNMSQLERISQKLHLAFSDRQGEGPTEVRHYLDTNRRLVVQLWYAGVGGGNIGHAFEVEARRTGQRNHAGNAISGWAWLVNDPIKTYSEWMDEDAVLAAMKTFAVKTGQNTGYRFGISQPVPKIAAGAR